MAEMQSKTWSHVSMDCCGLYPTGASFGTVLTLPITGLLCASDIAGGWPSVFYIFGSIGALWSIAWMLVIRDTPAKHPRISHRERKYIESSLGQIKNAKTPWLAMFTCRAFWGLMVGQFCSVWGFYTLLTNLPTYMREILHFDIAENGILSGIPYLVFMILTITSGFVADFLRERGIVSTAVVRKIFNSSGDLLAALFLMMIQFAGCDVTAAFVILVCSVGFSGLHGSGYLINHIDIAPQYAGTIMGITNSVATIPGFVAPYVVGVLTSEQQTREQWQIVFYISAAINIFGVIIFALFAEGEVQSWAKYNEDEEMKKVEPDKDRY